MQRLTPAIDNTFDMPFLAQHVLRRQWSSLSAAQQAEFTATLKDMVITTYASQFTKFNGEKFTTQETQDNGNMRAVRALLELPAGDPVHFEYVLRQTPAGWRTINVIAEGVSDLALRSAQYDKMFKDQGFDGLIKQIKDQTEKLKSSC
jgi:phospholipid transport system substrate-binding protein